MSKLMEWPEWLVSKLLLNGIRPQVGEEWSGSENDTLFFARDGGSRPCGPCAPIRPAATRYPYPRREAILSRLRQARRPGRGHMLNMSALAFGNMVAEGHMDRGFAERCLVEACKVNGLWAFDGERAVRREIERGLTYGMGVWRNGEREVG